MPLSQLWKSHGQTCQSFLPGSGMCLPCLPSDCFVPQRRYTDLKRSPLYWTARDILLRQKERLFYSPAGKRWNGFTVWVSGRVKRNTKKMKLSLSLCCRKDRLLKLYQQVSVKGKLHRRNTIRRTHCCPLWRLPVRKICRTMPSVKDWVLRLPVRQHWKSWFLPDLYSERKSSSFLRKKERTWSQSCRTISNLPS